MSLPISKPSRGATIASLVATLPIAALVWVLLAGRFWDLDRGWSVVVDSGLHFRTLILVLVVLGLFALAETRRRAKAGVARVPWFAIAGAGLLATVFVAPLVARPLVRLVPDWNRIARAATWDAPGGAITLELHGVGNESRQTYRGGALNGPKCLGVPLIRFRPLTLVGPTDPNAAELGPAEWLEARPTDASGLRLYLAAPDLPDDRLTALADSVWLVLNQANDGAEWAAPGATIAALDVRPDLKAEGRASAALWIGLTVVVFFAIGRFTLRARSPVAPSEDRETNAAA